MKLEELLKDAPDALKAIQDAIAKANEGQEDKLKHIRFADLSEGGYVSKDKYSSLEADLTGKTTELEKANGLIEELKKGTGKDEALQQKITDYEAEIATLKQQKDVFTRKYIVAERSIRRGKYAKDEELKACKISNSEKGKLYRSMNGAARFGVIINQRNVLGRIFQSKKDKQRYLDYAYKIGLKRALKKMIAGGVIEENSVNNVHVFADEHTTATNGRYELREGLEQELKNGTYNMQYDRFFPPVFGNMRSIELSNCDSSKVPLIRAADIVANRIYYMALNRNIEKLENIYLTTLP